jgi:hypothetical protein
MNQEGDDGVVTCHVDDAGGGAEPSGGRAPEAKQQGWRRGDDFLLDPALVAMIPPKPMFARRWRRGDAPESKINGMTTFRWAVVNPKTYTLKPLNPKP